MELSLELVQVGHWPCYKFLVNIEIFVVCAFTFDRSKNRDLKTGKRMKEMMNQDSLRISLAKLISNSFLITYSQ